MKRHGFMLLLACAAVLGCQTQPEKEPLPHGPRNPVSIAVIAPLSGPSARLGASEKNGVELAVRLANESGGLFGAPVRMAAEDGICEALQAKAKTKWVISVEEIKFIVGELCAEATVPATDLADDEGALMVSPVAVDERVTLRTAGALKTFVFKAGMGNVLQGRIAARFVRENLGKPGAAVLYDGDSGYSRELAEAFISGFASLGGRISARQDYSGDQADFTESLKLIAASRAEVLYVPDDARTAGRVASQAKKLGLEVTLVGGDAWEAGGLPLADFEGACFTTQFSALDTRPAVQEWVEEYRSFYGAAPDAAACLSFDAATLILSAIRIAGASDPAMVRDVLARGTWPAVTGPISFDAQHNTVKPGVVMRVKKGKIVFAAAVMP